MPELYFRVENAIVEIIVESQRRACKNYDLKPPKMLKSLQNVSGQVAMVQT